jgi:hypothetical protein
MNVGINGILEKKMKLSFVSMSGSALCQQQMSWRTFMTELNKIKGFPQGALRVLEEVVDALVAECDSDPREVEEARKLIVRTAYGLSNSKRGVTYNALSSKFYDVASRTANPVAQRELEGIAQIFGNLTGQRPGDKYYPRALRGYSKVDA